ncbi:hypothetical protein JD844_006761 [Phrynosoma platyrhinos]|uniref:RGS domain-containing protein n=1 Tax=Phrynosoma platyrhinos TaxID=52577 RepID=A0ABQ7T1V5_PHRPL|nr:hypothetical protein JD844_006761 [Phrynosoma platyrhinos]
MFETSQVTFGYMESKETISLQLDCDLVMNDFHQRLCWCCLISFLENTDMTDKGPIINPTSAILVESNKHKSSKAFIPTVAAAVSVFPTKQLPNKNKQLPEIHQLKQVRLDPMHQTQSLGLLEINDSDSKPGSSQQNLNGTRRWATSLENLLEDREGVKRFREFLKREFSEENVLFWLACEEFKKIHDKKQMQAKANEIYATFLSSKASSQVNVEGQSRLDESILEEPHPLMFQKLQDQIFSLMKYDSYSRFLKSDMFLKLKQTEEQEENSPDPQTVPKRASRIYNT